MLLACPHRAHPSRPSFHHPGLSSWGLQSPVTAVSTSRHAGRCPLLAFGDPQSQSLVSQWLLSPSVLPSVRGGAAGSLCTKTPTPDHPRERQRFEGENGRAAHELGNAASFLPTSGTETVPESLCLSSVCTVGHLTHSHTHTRVHTALTGSPGSGLSMRHFPRPGNRVSLDGTKAKLL